MPDHPNGTIRLVVVTTARDIEDELRLDQSLELVFDKTSCEVGANEIRINSRLSTTTSLWPTYRG